MESKKENNVISIMLSNDEALVLFDWLTRFNENEHPQIYQDQAEERILFDLESTLEKIISQSFHLDYKKILLIAREKIRDIQHPQ